MQTRWEMSKTMKAARQGYVSPEYLKELQTYGASLDHTTTNTFLDMYNKKESLMNKRIKEIYKQARSVALSVDDIVLEDWERECARLIILECAQLFADDGSMSSLAEYVHNSRVHDQILEHFGVKP